VKKVRERSPLRVAAVAAAVFIVLGFLALDFANLPLIGNTQTHQAYFATAVGLKKGDVVTIAGVRVGKISSISLKGTMVQVDFTVQGGARLGNDTAVDTKIINPVGVEYLEVVPRGPGKLSGPIPLARTTVPGTLISDLNQLTVQTKQTNIPQLVQSLDVLTQGFAATAPADTKAALQGISQFSATLANRSNEVTDLITQTDDLTKTLNNHSGQLVDLISQANVVLGVLNQRQAAVQSLLATTSSLSGELDHILKDDEPSIRPLLANLASVSQYLSSESGNIKAAIPQLAAFAKYAANVLGSGPFGDTVAPNVVVPDNLLKQCSSVGNLNPLLGCRP
jgi:phospholipid/cholesterol/gamma-HCH transport system substrate-binding protein